MLALYTVSPLFPGGDPAAEYPVSVIIRGGNQLALLFTDQTGATAVPNPVTTDEFGVASFYAAPGDYVVHLAGADFGVNVDSSFTDPVWPGLWVHTQLTPAAAWSVAHHFGVRPQVDVVISGESAEAAVAHPDSENTTITFGAPTAGVAHLRR